jgi:hypothetical protein
VSKWAAGSSYWILTVWCPDISQGRTPGKFRERMTLSLVESNKKSVEQMEAVLARLKSSSVSTFLASSICTVVD